MQLLLKGDVAAADVDPDVRQLTSRKHTRALIHVRDRKQALAQQTPHPFAGVTGPVCCAIILPNPTARAALQ
jgi:hypothetical protein